MKKFIISILSSLMLVSCIGFNVYAEEGGPLGSTDPVEIPEEYAAQVANIAINFAWAFSGGGNLLLGSCLSGGIVGIVDIATDLLEQIVYFGPSKEETDRQELMDKLTSIDASIGDVSSKVDSLADQINSSIKLIDAQLDNISIKLDKDNITNVANIATYIENQMNNYDSDLSGQLQIWYNNKNLNDFLTVDQFVVRVPNKNKVLEDDKEVITIGGHNLYDVDVVSIDGSLMSEKLNDYLLEHKAEDNNGWKTEQSDDIVKEIFRRIINDDRFDKSSSTEFDTWMKNTYDGYSTWDSFNQKDEAIEALAQAGYGTLCEIAARKLAKSDDYVKSLIEKFTLYCNYLKEEGGQYTSPLKSYANIYSSIYAFQGDLKRSIEVEDSDTHQKKTEETNLLKMNMQKYISDLYRYGTFIGMMAKASGNYGDTTGMVSQIYLPWVEAEESLKQDYSKYYHVRGGRDVDNYCYITKTVLDYRYGYLTCDLVMKFYAWENGFGTDIKSYRDTYMDKDWAFSIDNSQIADSTSMNLIFAHYANTNGNIPFKDYLVKNGTGADKYDRLFDLPSEIITRFVGSRDFTSDDKVKMFIKNCHNNPDKWEGKDFLRGDTTTVTSSSKYFKLRKKATADVFDLKTGISTLGKRVGAVASFYEKYTFKDDLVVFWDAEYNSPQTIDELKKLAASDGAFYNRERYDTKSDDEERYRSHVNYLRRYGVLLSCPLDFSTPIDTENNRYFGVEDPSKNYKQTNVENDLEEALKQAGISKQEYEDFVYDGTYHIYFDEGKFEKEVSQDTYSDLIAFCQIQNNIDEMTNDYYELSDEINEMIDNLGGNNQISKNSQTINSVGKKLIEEELDCIVVDSIPSTNQGKSVYDYSSGKLYVWIDGEYKKYDDIEDTKNKEFEEEPISNPNTDELIDDSVYPKASSVDLRFEYQIKPVFGFELFFNENNEVEYKVHPLLDVTPVLMWKDGGVDKQKEVTNKVLSASNINHVDILLPILKIDHDGDNRALVNHYSDLMYLESPMEVLSSKIKVLGGYRYALLSVQSFSPFEIEYTYREQAKKTKKVPSTGIE